MDGESQLSLYTYFFGDKVVGLGEMDLGDIKLKGGGNTPLDVVCPFVNLVVEDNTFSLFKIQKIFNLVPTGFYIFLKRMHGII